MKTSSILCITEDGHCLVDGPASVDNALPNGWRCCSLSPPPKEPYNSHATSKTASHVDSRADAATHAELRAWLEDAIARVQQKWTCTRGISRWSSFQAEAALSPDQSELDLIRLATERCQFQTVNLGFAKPIQLEQIITVAQQDLVGSAYINTASKPAILQCAPASYLIPPRSGFILSDMKFWHAYLSHLDMRWNAIILDPPWRSTSARRSGEYEEMDNYDLFQINLPDLLLRQAAQKPCLIATWVTNNPKHRRFVRDKLYPDWGISQVVDWWWVKITDPLDDDVAQQAGLPVWSLDGTSPRRCYEGLIIGLYNPFRLAVPTPLPDKKAFLSVPLGHSRKPNLRELLLPYLSTRHPYMLELFARFTPAGNDGKTSKGLWFSVGNEPIRHNHIGAHVVQTCAPKA